MDAGTILTQFYDAVRARDMAKARTYLADDMVFEGLFETYPNADAYIATFTQLMGIVSRLDVKTIVGDGDEATIFMEMETTAPVAATTLVAEWHRTRNGKIVRAQSAFDGRPFAAMFAPSMARKRTDLIVIASAMAKPGKEADLERALREVGGPTREQPGCVEFALHRRKDDKATIIGFERWASAEAHQRHLQGAHVARLMGRMADILAEPPVIASYEVLDERD